ALAAAADGLRAARGNAGVLVGGRVTEEDAYAYAKFARTVLATDDIDFRARPHSPEEAEFLAALIAGQGVTVDYDSLERAPIVLLAGFEPEEESPIVYLRLSKAARRRGVRVVALAPYASRGLRRMSGNLVPTVPGAEPYLLDAAHDADALPDLPAEAVDADAPRGTGRQLRQERAVISVGDRRGGGPGGRAAAGGAAAGTGAGLGWGARRAGERGALGAGALAGLLPGGRRLTDPKAREQIAAAWHCDDLATAPGRDTAGILGTTPGPGALLVGGVELADLPDPAAARAALDAAPCVGSLELRHSELTARAEVV